MAGTLHQFGLVLFHELLQIAVRRGGFASLKWVKKKLKEAESGVEQFGDEVWNPNVDLPSLKKKADEAAQGAKDALAVAARTAEAVEELGRIISDMVKTAQQVGTKLQSQSPEKPDEGPFWQTLSRWTQPQTIEQAEQRPVRALLDRARAKLRNILFGRLRRPKAREPWTNRVDDVQAKLVELEARCRETRGAMNAHLIREQSEMTGPERRFQRTCRVAWRLDDLGKLGSDDRRLAEDARAAFLEAAPEPLEMQAIDEQVTRGAIILRSKAFASALQVTLGEFAKVITAFKTMAEVQKGPIAELVGLVAELPAAARYEIYETVERAARNTAKRMETVGLAFSGGGIRSATFNLGILQGAAALGLLKQFDYLSTVSGGGYIGAWFAAWVLREGAGTASRPRLDAADRTSRALENVQKQLSSSRVRQATAVRRWLPDRDDGRPVSEHPVLEALPVEEEPEALYHLRAHSNYLAPRVGLLSIDMWTMVSVYLRNLFLNQFILLPTLLAVIAVQRLLLLLYTHSTSGPIFAPARSWLAAHDLWPALTVYFCAIVVCSTLPMRVDQLGVWLARCFHPLRGARCMLALLWIGIAVLPVAISYVASMFLDHSPGTIAAVVRWPALNHLSTVLPILLILAAIAAWRRRRIAKLARHFARKRYRRARGWGILAFLVLAAGVIVGPALAATLRVADAVFGWLTGDGFLFALTLAAASVGFCATYLTVAELRLGHGPIPVGHTGRIGPFWAAKLVLCSTIVVPLILVAFGVSLLFSRPGRAFFVCPVGTLDNWFNPAHWNGLRFMPAICFGLLVGSIRLLLCAAVNWKSRSQWQAFEREGRGLSALWSGVISGTGLATALMWLSGLDAEHPGGRAALLMTFGPALVLTAMGAGAAIEVGLIGGYRDEDMREWRASLGAYLLRFGTVWTLLCLLSVYGPLLFWWAGRWVAVSAIAGWVLTSLFGALARRTEPTEGVKPRRRRLERITAIAPAVFSIGLVIAVSVLAAALQGVHVPVTGDGVDAGRKFLERLAHAAVGDTLLILIISSYLAFVACAHLNINLFGLHPFYANRLVRCYLGASRPSAVPRGQRPRFAPTGSPGPHRRPNPITGFARGDDFPLRDLAIVRDWDRADQDLVVDYRGPYHLINTAMNLVGGSELAWQERMAESFILSPLYCGSKTTGYRRAGSIVRSDVDDEELQPDERCYTKRHVMAGYGDDVRLGTAISVSGAAASPNAGYQSSPLVTIMMTMLNARLGRWFGNPAGRNWRHSSPGHAFYLLGELLGLTTGQGRYVNLSDGGHFENLGAYELVRRRCRYIVVCDAGCDPALAFWDLGSLVRKCREDFGIRIEIEISPLLRKDGTAYSRWHCAVGQIHYDEVDAEAFPGTLLYIKASMSGDEPSDVRNYVVDHPAFPHESTADQFFSESRFESYRVLGEHVALNVFRDVVRDLGSDASPAALFSRLRRQWAQAPPNLDEDFLESVKPFVKVHEALRTDPKLEGLSRELYARRGLACQTGAPTEAIPSSGDDRADVHAVIQMLQAMENAWIAVDLDAYSDHPLNRGWMNVFRRWISSGSFHAHWPAVRGEFSEGFVRFCESELNLSAPKPTVVWLEGVPERDGRETIALPAFQNAVRELDKEFSLEWPHVVLHEIHDARIGLWELFEHACKHPPEPGKPMAVLIKSGGASLGERSTTEPSYYGVVLAWESADGVVDVVVWLRGAYRTLGLGGITKKAIDDFKKDLKDLRAVKHQGYTLRTRYPTDERSKGKQRWQRMLWTDFFRNQGFHRDGSDGAGNDSSTLIYRYEPG
jgi:hypothetical protein